MKLTFTIVLHDMTLFLKSGGIIILTAVLALLGLACYTALPVSIFENGSMPAVDMALVNPDKGAYSETLSGLLRGLPEIASLTDCDSDEAERLLEEGKVSVVMELPDDVVGVLVNNRPDVIKIRAKDPLAGVSAYSVAAAAADTMNMLQTAVYKYYDLARPLAKNEAFFYISYNKFCLELISDVLSHRKLIDTQERGIGPYMTQLLALLMFIICAGSGLCVSVLAAEQRITGEFRRLRLRGVNLAHLYAGKLILSVGAAVFYMLILAVVLNILNVDADIGGLAGATALLTLISAPIFIMISFAVKSSGQAALVGTAILLICLFLGGGFYPAYLMNMGIMDFNPARLNVLLVGFVTAEDSFPAGAALGCACVSAVCGAVSVFIWRRIKL